MLFISFSYIYIIVEERNDKIVMETIKVSSKSEPNKVAGALANVFREKGVVEVQAIGAGALNQAIKGVAIARGFVAPSGKNWFAHQYLLILILMVKKKPLLN